eukprot:Skav214374  [mRNA]  locus=scaffold1789:24432:28522:+ [translate_table: standard]
MTEEAAQRVICLRDVQADATLLRVFMNLGNFSRDRACRWQNENPQATAAETLKALNRGYAFEACASGRIFAVLVRTYMEKIEDYMNRHRTLAGMSLALPLNANVRRLKADLDSIHAFLKSMQQRRGFDAMRSSQAQQLAGRISQINNLTILASISDALHQAQIWTQDQLNMFDDSSVTASMPKQGGEGPDKKMQTMRNFGGYLSVGDVRELSSPAVPILAKAAVGLKNPTETSIREIFRAGMAAGMEITAPVSREALGFVIRFKTMLKRKTKGLDDEGMVKIYPVDPGALPERWRQGYQSDPPAGFVLQGKHAGPEFSVVLRESGLKGMEHAQAAQVAKADAFGSGGVAEALLHFLNRIREDEGPWVKNPTIRKQPLAICDKTDPEQLARSPEPAAVETPPQAANPVAAKPVASPAASPAADAAASGVEPAQTPMEMEIENPEVEYQKFMEAKRAREAEKEKEQRQINSMKRPSACIDEKPKKNPQEKDKSKKEKDTSKKDASKKETNKKGQSKSKSTSGVFGKSIYGLERDRFKKNFRGSGSWEEAWRRSKECQSVLAKMSAAERAKRRLSHLYKGT